MVRSTVLDALPALPRVKCLLVDDLEENLLALSALLQHDDVELLMARSGAEALELLLVNEVALALVDVQMPDMDGFELAELIRGSERTRDIPLIFVTAGARDQRRLFAGYETGAVDFLYKPIDPHILKSKADVFFQLYRQRQMLAHQLVERTETLRLNEMFTAVLGHDLRNPLSAIVMAAGLLKRNNPDEAVQKAATEMLASGKRMSRMIEDMLDLARSRLGSGIPLKREKLDLGSLVARVVREHAIAYPTCRIDVTHIGDLSGEWDADRLAQVVSNLLGNALNHGSQGEPIEVQIDGTRPGEVALGVINSGTIPEDMLPNLFDPFVGAQRKTEGPNGLGLGLFIVQQIVHAHHGSVEVRTPDEGRVDFRVTIPR